MTERERVLTLLGGGCPDRVPWFGDLDYWAGSLVGRGLRPPDFKSSDAYLDWHRELGVGFYLQGCFPFQMTAENCEVKEWREPGKRLREIHTPEGTLRECWTQLEDAFTEAPTEHLLKSADDLPAYRFFHANARYQPDYSQLDLRHRQVGDTGVVLAYLPKSPFMQMVALDAGLETVIDMLSDEPELFDETLEVVKASHDLAARIAVDSPAEILMIPENLSAEMVGPPFFHRYLKPYQSQWADAIKQAGKFSCIHMDGTLKGLIREEFQVGLTFVEALTPAPVGDLAVADWSSFVGPTDTLFWGGIPGTFFSPQTSDAEFDRHVRETLEIMRTEPRYVLGVADQVPPDGLESRVRRVRELVDECGAY
jgi:uroporphyrinogen-III decarboxylase